MYNQHLFKDIFMLIYTYITFILYMYICIRKCGKLNVEYEYEKKTKNNKFNHLLILYYRI